MKNRQVESKAKGLGQQQYNDIKKLIKQGVDRNIAIAVTRVIHDWLTPSKKGK